MVMRLNDPMLTEILRRLQSDQTIPMVGIIRYQQGLEAIDKELVALRAQAQELRLLKAQGEKDLVEAAKPAGRRGR